jgi:excisionase family DNA binding protein
MGLWMNWETHDAIAWQKRSLVSDLDTVPVVPAVPAPCKDFMNLKEAAAYFGVSIWSVRGLIASGFIRAKRIGKYDIVSRAELAEYWQKAA